MPENLRDFYSDEDWEKHVEYAEQNDGKSQAELTFEGELKSESIDSSGNPTYKSFNDSVTVGEEYAERSGMKRDEKGFFEAAYDASERARGDIQTGLAKTFGLDGLVRRNEVRRNQRKDLYTAGLSDGKLALIGDSIGSGLTESAALIGLSTASTAITGSPVAGAAIGFGGTYARLYGENEEKISSVNTVGLSKGQVKATAIILTLGQAGLESGFGLEAQLGKALAGSQAKKIGSMSAEKLTGKLLKSKEGQSLIRRMSSEFFKPTNVISGGIAGGIKETVEESLQEWGAIGAEYIASGHMPTDEEIIDRTIIQPLRAIPAGMLMGAGGALGNSETEGAKDSKIVEVDVNAETDIHGEIDPETGDRVMTEASIADLEAEREAFSALENEIIKVKSVSRDQAMETADFLRRIAYSMSKLTSKHANTAEDIRKPIDFIESLKVVAMRGDIDSADLSAIKAIQSDESLTPEEISNKTLSYIAGKHGNKGEFYKAMNSINQASQIMTLRKHESELAEGVRQQAPEFLDERAVKAFNQNVKASVTSLISKSKDINIDLKEDGRAEIDIHDIPDGLIDDTEIAQIYMYGASISIGKAKYNVTARGETLVIRPSSEVLSEFEAEKSKHQESVTRKTSEKESGQFVTDEEIGSDDALMTARAEYSMYANKALGLDSFMETYKSRNDWVQGSAENIRHASKEVFTSPIGESVTGADIARQALDDAASDNFDVDDQVSRMAEMDSYGEKASDLYISTFIAEAEKFQRVVEETASSIEAEKSKKRESRFNAINEMRSRIESYRSESKRNRPPKKDRAKDPMVTKATIGHLVGQVEDSIDSAGVGSDTVFLSKNRKLLDAMITAADNGQEGTVRSLGNKVKRAASRRAKQRKAMSKDELLEATSDGAAEEFSDYKNKLDDVKAPDALMQNGPVAGGAYLKSKNTAIFFASADVGTIIHELTHHMSSVLPAAVQSEIQQSLAEVDGVAEEIKLGIFGEKTEEALADSMNKYILDGELNQNLSDEGKLAYKNIRNSIGKFTQMQIRNFELLPEVEAFFNKTFTDVSELEIHGVMAEAAMNGIDLDPPSSNQVSDAKEQDFMTQVNMAEISADATRRRTQILTDRIAGKGKWKKGKKDRSFSEQDYHLYEVEERGYVMMKDGYDNTWHIVDEYLVEDGPDYVALEDGSNKYPVEDLYSRSKADAIIILEEEAATAIARQEAIIAALKAEKAKGDVLLQERRAEQEKAAESGDTGTVEVDDLAERVSKGYSASQSKKNSEARKSDMMFSRADRYKENATTAERRKKTAISHLHGRYAIKYGEKDIGMKVRAMALEMFPDEFSGKTIHNFSVKELSLAQINQLNDSLNARKKNNQSSEKIRRELMAEIKDQPTADHPHKVYDKKRKAYSAKIMNAFKKAIDLNNTYFMNTSFFTKMMDGFKYNGAWNKYIMTPISEARQIHMKTFEGVAERIATLKEKHGLGYGTLDQRRKIQLGDRSFNESEVILLSLAGKKVKNEDGVMSTSLAQQAIMESNDITEEQFNEAVNMVSKDKRLSDYSKYLSDAYNEIYDVVAPVYERVTGNKLTKVDNYFPMMRKDTMFSSSDPVASALEFVNAKGRDIQKGQEDSHLRGRTQLGGSEIRLDNAEAAMASYANSASNYAAKAEVMRDINQALSSPEIKNHMKRVYGGERGGKMYGMMEKLMAREMFANAKSTGMDDGQMIAKDIRNRFTLAMLGGRFMTMPKQMVSFLNFMAVLNGALSPRFVTSALVNSFEITATIMKNAGINMKKSANKSWKEDGYNHLLEGHRLKDLLKEKAPLLYSRHGNPETGDINEHGYKGFLALEIAGTPIGDVALFGLEMFDMITVGTAFLTGYEHVKGIEERKGTSQADASRIAASTVSAMISDTQPPSVAHERTPGQTDNEWLAGAFPFSGQTMLNWQNWNNTVAIPAIKLISAKNFKGLTENEGYYASVAQRLSVGFIVPAIVLGTLARRRFQKDKDEMILDVLMYPVSQIPAFGGQLAHGIGSGWRDSRAEPVYMSVANDVTRTLIDFSNVIRGESKFGDRQVEDLEEAASIILSVPTSYTKFLHVMYKEYSHGRLGEFRESAVREALGITIAD